LQSLTSKWLNLIFTEKTNQKTLRDFIYYLSGSLILAIIAIIRLPVFTSHFTPSEFGVFSLVSITYTYLSVTLYNWITSCIYRYFHEYGESKQYPELFSNIIFLFLVSSMILLLISVCWYWVAGSQNVRELVIPAFCYLFTGQVFNMFLVIFKLQGKSLNYNLYQIVQAAFSFLFILLLIFWMKLPIKAIFTGQIIINVVLLSILTIKNSHFLKQISPGFLSMALIRKLVRYGSIGLISSAGIFILISSDRYIIALFEDMSRVGIYNQVYQVGQVSVYFLVTVFFNTITPGFNQLLTGYSRKNEKLLLDYVNAFVLLVLPATFYVSVFAKQVSEFLLGEAFREGYTMIPWIVISSFIYGLTLFNETKLKFEHHFKPVVWGVVIACLLNICLNFIFIPRFGYAWAAINTFIAYFFLFIFYYVKDNFSFFRDIRLIRIILITMVVLVIQVLVDMFIRRVMDADLNKWLTLLEATLFFAIYMGVVIRLKLFRIRG
jgi:O-antigen/teichoic acid export membrane protein